MVAVLLLWRWCRSKRRLPVHDQQKQVRAVEIVHQEDRAADLEKGGVTEAPQTITPNETPHQNLEEGRQALTRHGATVKVDKEEASVEQGANQLSMEDSSALHGTSSAGQEQVAVATQQNQLVEQICAERVGGLAAEQMGGTGLVSLEARAVHTEQDVDELERTLQEVQGEVSSGIFLRRGTLKY